jgi:hypothetical protein
VLLVAITVAFGIMGIAGSTVPIQNWVWFEANPGWAVVESERLLVVDGCTLLAGNVRAGLATLS